MIAVGQVQNVEAKGKKKAVAEQPVPVVPEALCDSMIIDLYADIAPGSEGWTHQEGIGENLGHQAVFNVVKPQLIAFIPAKDKAKGVAAVICPGGGMTMLNFETEGTMVARELNRRGITAFVLKYRTLPLFDDGGNAVSNTEGMTNAAGRECMTAIQKANEQFLVQGTTKWVLNIPTVNLSFADVDRAMSLIRENMGKWRLSKVGIVGFSAGAIASISQAQTHSPGSRPDFTCAIYGGWTNDVKVPEDAAPLYIIAVVNDIFTPEETMAPYYAWRDAKVPVGLHIFDHVKHGFGAVQTGKSADRWIDLMTDFLADCEIIQ